MWVGPFTKENEILNRGYLDDGAVYWVSVYRIPEEGAYITFEGGFPYSRYMSLSTYRIIDTTLGDSLKDRDISAKTGSVNTFVEGNPRNDPYRYYQITMEAGERSDGAASAAENTLYDLTPAVGVPVLLFYRNYVPNTGADQTGDVGLPRVTLHRADGTIQQGEEACTALNAGFEPGPPTYFPADSYGNLRGAVDPSHNPPVFRTEYGLEYQVQCGWLNNCGDTPPKGSLPFLNADADYMYSFLNRQHGEVLVMRGQIPVTPETLDGADAAFMEGELRYWSICQYEYYSQKVEACLFDEQIGINDDGFYTIVSSRPEDRPDNATDECGVSFMAWPEDGDGFAVAEGRENNPDDGYMLVRNLLPASDFTQAIHNTSVSGDETEVLGNYMPKGQYFSKSEFEGLGCNPWLALPYEDMP